MININENFLDLQDSYLFSTIAKKVKAFQEANPDKKIIKLGIGDVTLPLAKACVDAMKKAADEMLESKTFKGYGPEQGYEFLKDNGIDCVLEWNKGNHFKNPDMRTAKAFAWLMNRDKD